MYRSASHPLALLPLLSLPAEAYNEATKVRVALTPRYPLFGGWSIRFLFGWSLPLADVVSKVRRLPQFLVNFFRERGLL